MASHRISPTHEDYLETILALRRQSPVVRVSDLARALKIRMPSVTAALKSLQAEGLIRHERYGHVELTPEGQALAEQVHRRHITLVGFLTDILQLDPEEAEEEACELEHGLRPKTLRRLIGLLEFVAGCPRSSGDWLAHMRGRWEDRDCDHNCRECIRGIQIPPRGPFGPLPCTRRTTTLDLQQPGFRGRVVRVTGHGPIRRRLMEMGVTPGTQIEVVRFAPLGDPIEVKLRGYHLSLRRSEAANVCVEPE